MRVTSKMVNEKILSNVSSALERLQYAQTQMATGKRTLKPSDDPIDVAKALRVKALLADNLQFQRNIDDGVDWLENTEPMVDEMVAVITELKEIATSGASDSKTDVERAVLGEEVDALIERLVGLANSRCGQRYVFAGAYTLIAPYRLSYEVSDESVSLPDLEWTDLGNARLKSAPVTVSGPGGQVYVEGVDYEIDYEMGRIRRLAGGAMGAGSYTVSYQTETVSAVDLSVPDTDGVINREIAQGVYRAVNIGGQEILASGTDVFDLLLNVKTALFRNEGDSVNQALDDIDLAVTQVASALGKVGTQRNAFDLARAKLESQMVNHQAVISNLEDADLAEVMVRFQTEQMAYESALAAAATIMNISLINFIQ
jgi:flagellar hook-associated protein 3 FlgL